MKDFAKSIVCNTKAEAAKVGNAGFSIVKVDDDSDDFGSSKRKGMYKVIDERGSSLGWFKTMEEAKKEKEFWEKQKVGNALKYTNLEEAKKMCQQMNDSLAPDAALRHYRHVYEKDGAYYVMETGEAVAKGMKRVGNSKCGNAEVVKDGSVWVVLYAEGTKSKEFDSEAEAKKFAAQVGNSKVGNADPRIASIKSKLPMLEKQNDVGGLKDVASFVEDSIKDLRKRLDQLEKDYNAAKNDYNDWLDLRSKVQASYQLASRK